MYVSEDQSKTPPFIKRNFESSFTRSQFKDKKGRVRSFINCMGSTPSHRKYWPLYGLIGTAYGYKGTWLGCRYTSGLTAIADHTVQNQVLFLCTQKQSYFCANKRLPLPGQWATRHTNSERFFPNLTYSERLLFSLKRMKEWDNLLSSFVHWAVLLGSISTTD